MSWWNMYYHRETSGAKFISIVLVVLILAQGIHATVSNDERSRPRRMHCLAELAEGRLPGIFGTIQTTNFRTAKSVSLNPAGILFRIDCPAGVGGSFHATTADSIKLGADGVVYADPAKASALTSAPPSAFGFRTANPGPINVQAGALTGSTFTAAAGAPGDNYSISLVGGPVNVGPPAGQLRGAGCVAPGGRVNLVSVASEGEATFDGSGLTSIHSQQLGQINITEAVSRRRQERIHKGW